MKTLLAGDEPGGIDTVKKSVEQGVLEVASVRWDNQFIKRPPVPWVDEEQSRAVVVLFFRFVLHSHEPSFDKPVRSFAILLIASLCNGPRLLVREQ